MAVVELKRPDLLSSLRAARALLSKDGDNGLLRIAELYQSLPPELQIGMLHFLNLGPKQMVAVVDPHLAQGIARDHTDALQRGEENKLAERVFGNSLITTYGEGHNQDKRMLQPDFGFAKASVWSDQIFSPKFRELFHFLQKKNGAVDMVKWNGEIARAVISQRIFGENHHQELEEVIPHIFSETKRGVLWGQIKLPLPPNRRYRKYAEKVRAAFSAVVDYYLDLDSEKLPKDGYITKLVQMYRNEAANLDKNWLVDHLIELFGAGSDTVASTSDAINFALTEHPRYQTSLRSNLQRKISELFPGIQWQTLDAKERKRVIDAVPEFRYFLNEILRLYPAAPIDVFQLTKDIFVAIGNGDEVLLNRGTQFIFAINLMNQHPDIWGDQYNPKEFHPERFAQLTPAQLEVQKRNMTFMQGTETQCLGMSFAQQYLDDYLFQLLLQTSDITRVTQLPKDRPTKVSGTMQMNAPEVFYEFKFA